MTHDLYTLAKMVTPSDEHVIPNFLGGKLQCTQMLDKATNDAFGFGIDARLERALRPFLTIIDARSDRDPSRPAPTLKGLRSSDGAQYDLAAGGRVITRPHFQMTVDGATLTFSGSAPNEALVKTHLTNWVRKKGLSPELIDMALASAKRNASPPPELHIPVELFNTDCYRAVAKIACNLFAHHEAELFRSDQFSQIRRWVLGTEELAAPLVELLEPLSDTEPLGEFDHLAIVTISDDGAVVGTVQLLGSIVFGVAMGTVPPGNARKMSYRVDQLERLERQDAAIDLRVNPESFVEAAARTYEQFQELARRHLELLWPRVDSRQRALLMQRLWAEATKELHLQPDGDWSADEKVHFASLMASKYVDHFIRHRRRLEDRDGDESA